MKIDICVPVYNGGMYIEKTLLSVLTQVTNHEINLRVIDDKSNDDSIKKIIDLKNLFDFEFTENPVNVGLMAVNKVFAETSEADALIFLGQDDLLPSNHVQTAVDELCAKKAALVWFNPVIIDQSHKIYAAKFKLDFKQIIKSKVASLFFARSNFISSCGLIVRRNALLEVGNWPQDYKNYGEWLLWLRIAMKNRIAYSKKSLPYYRVHVGSLTSELHGQNASFMAYTRQCKTEARDVLFKKFI